MDRNGFFEMYKDQQLPLTLVIDWESIVPYCRCLCPGSAIPQEAIQGTGTCRLVLTPPLRRLSHCRVHRVEALGVVDCSIMPNTVSRNTDGPPMAVAGRAAELILERRRNCASEVNLRRHCPVLRAGLSPNCRFACHGLSFVRPGPRRGSRQAPETGHCRQGCASAGG